ncbi:MAG TPA: hypothetical protein VNJ08_10905 [Bacteriovoracaceae bacterium]|nr:hypothetical protein [Bacteriovoracaceae bacterium]
MKILFTTCLISFSALAAPLELKRSWSRISNPLIMNATFERSFSKLPLNGMFKGEKRMWSGDYWALKKGNINQRWNLPVPVGFKLISPTREEVIAMDIEALKTLAPSEKFDLLNGRYDYPLKNKIAKIARETAQDWEGICHGWALATMHHDEPQPKILNNPENIPIPFGSADIKALISHYYARVHEVESTYQIGRRCRTLSPIGGDTCKHDMNAGAFHIVMANQIGLKAKSFVADLNFGTGVANHSLHSYTTSIQADDLPPGRKSAPGTVKRIRVATDLKYVTESDKNTWLPVLGTDLQKYKNLIFKYNLDIDRSGNIIGGDWLSKERPDFLWTMSKVKTFKDEFARLKELMD